MNKTNQYDDGNAIDNKTATSELKANLAKSKSELAILKKESREQNKIARDLKAQVKAQKERVEHDEYLIMDYDDCQKSRVRLMALIERGFSAEYILDRRVSIYDLSHHKYNEQWMLSRGDISLLHKVVAGDLELSAIPQQYSTTEGRDI